MSEVRLAYIQIAAASLRPDDSKRSIAQLIEEAYALPDPLAKHALRSIAIKLLETSKYDN